MLQEQFVEHLSRSSCSSHTGSYVVPVSSDNDCETQWLLACVAGESTSLSSVLLIIPDLARVPGTFKSAIESTGCTCEVLSPDWHGEPLSSGHFTVFWAYRLEDVQPFQWAAVVQSTGYPPYIAADVASVLGLPAANPLHSDLPMSSIAHNLSCPEWQARFETIVLFLQKLSSEISATGLINCLLVSVLGTGAAPSNTKPLDDPVPPDVNDAIRFLAANSPFQPGIPAPTARATPLTVKCLAP